MDIVRSIRTSLHQNADPATAKSGRRFFKEPINALGVKAGVVKQIAESALKANPQFAKKDIFSACEKLWRSGCLEETFVAGTWAYAVRDDYVEDDFSVFERWVMRYVDNWASCDHFCNHAVGELVIRYPTLVAQLKEWTSSPNRWVRRASAVSLIIPVRQGLFLEETFVIAESLLSDPDDLVQKGYGWLLKAASEAHCDEVFRFVVARKKTMPRTAYRYAIEKMPPAKRQEAMRKDA